MKPNHYTLDSPLVKSRTEDTLTLFFSLSLSLSACCEICTGASGRPLSGLSFLLYAYYKFDVYIFFFFFFGFSRIECVKTFSLHGTNKNISVSFIPKGVGITSSVVKV